MRVAIVLDRFLWMGGAERVALKLREAFPGSTTFAGVADRQMARSVGIDDLRTTSLQRLVDPLGGRVLRAGVLLQPRTFRRLDLRGFDLVVSSSVAFEKGVIPPPGTPHLCYCHTPPRYLWDLADSHFAEMEVPTPVRWGLEHLLAPWMRRQDLRAATGVDRYLANSHHVAARIRRYYDRDAQVVYPPVAPVPAPTGQPSPGAPYLLALARLYPYKRVDLAVEAANQLGRRLIVCGDGPDRGRLERLAGPTVEFVGWVGEAQKASLLAGAEALVAPQVEDFGLATAEALSAGTPAIAFGEGGSAEIISDAETGVLVASQDVGSVVAAIERFDRLDFDPDLLRRSAERFAPDRFVSEVQRVAGELVAEASG